MRNSSLRPSVRRCMAETRKIKPKCHWTCTRVNGQTILSCDFTNHLKRCHYDPKLLDNATLANSCSQVEIQ